MRVESFVEGNPGLPDNLSSFQQEDQGTAKQRGLSHKKKMHDSKCEKEEDRQTTGLLPRLVQLKQTGKLGGIGGRKEGGTDFIFPLEITQCGQTLRS